MKVDEVVLAEYKRTRASNPSYPAKWALRYARDYAEAIRQENRDDISIELRIEPDDKPMMGNLIASGDEAVDRSYISKARERLDYGDWWAWGVVEVRVTKTCDKCGVEHLVGQSFLGGCSFEGEEDFKRSGYYTNMIREALNEAEEE